MYNGVNSVSLEYGDTEITFYSINLKKTKEFDSIWHSHNYYEFHICANTFSEYDFNDRKITLKPNELLIIPPNTTHTSIKNAEAVGNGVTVFSITVSQIRKDKRFYNIFISALNDNALKPLPFPDIQRIAPDIFRQEKLYHSFLGVCRLKSEAANFIYLLFGRIIKDICITEYNQKDTFVLIDNLINQPSVTLDEIAAATHYSKRHISRLIKNRYGMSLTELRKRSNEGNPYE